MNWFFFISGLLLGLALGAGIVLAYVSYSFSRSMKSFEEEMELLSELTEREED